MLALSLRPLPPPLLPNSGIPSPSLQNVDRNSHCCNAYPNSGLFQNCKSPAKEEIAHIKSFLQRNLGASTVAAAAINEEERSSSLSALDDLEENGEEEEFQVLTATRSKYNDILILETRESRILLLDDSQNVHSILYKRKKWTDSYWDEFASLPAIVPEGPLAIFGLGGGTAAHLILNSWPSKQLDGWELDEILNHVQLIDKAREYFGLSDLEKHTDAGGLLRIHIGDALSSSTNIPGGYAGIIVDLFSDGKVLPQLEEVETWLELSKRMMTRGRVMVNCGGFSGSVASDVVDENSEWLQNSAMKALFDAFNGQLNWKKMPDRKGANYLAVTGPLPDLTSWSAAVPNHLSSSVKLWRPCQLPP
ncbi:hypothetical protein Ancab_015834 [Ancistrocladus abbreviatus]